MSMFTICTGFVAEGKIDESLSQMRKQEAVYTELALDDDSLDRQSLLQAMVAHPILIERPIAVANGRAALGRPPEKVLDVL